MSHIKRLQEREKELMESKAFAEHLEELVQERTAELKNLNAELQKNLYELQSSEERFRSLVYTIPDIIYRVDTAGNFVFLNDSGRRLAHDPQKLIGKHFSEIVFFPDAEAVARSVVLPKYAGKTTGDRNAPKLFDERRTGKRKTTALEIRLAIKTRKRLERGSMGPIGKQMVLVEVSSSGMYEIDPNTKKRIFIGTVGVIRDVSERKQAEEALLEAQKELTRKEKLAVLGQLAGGVGHELRNPLGAIKNAAYFLKMALEKPESEVKETLQILEKEVATSEKIISSLLNFARPKSPTRRKVDIKELLQEVLSHIKVPESVKVVNELEGSLPAILADPDQLSQVFSNLILNAIQAMPEGGKLAVKSEAASSAWVAISFTDTGVGIPEKNLERLFEPLFTTKARGIGLGLALTRTLIEGHGGTIKVESKEGKGATFTLRLPMDGGKEG